MENINEYEHHFFHVQAILELLDLEIVESQKTNLRVTYGFFHESEEGQVTGLSCMEMPNCIVELSSPVRNENFLVEQKKFMTFLIDFANIYASDEIRVKVEAEFYWMGVNNLEELKAGRYDTVTRPIIGA